MKGFSLQQFWEENKRFTLIVGGGMVVFLFLNSFLVSGARSAAEETNRGIKSSQGLETQVASLYKLLRDQYNIERSRLDDFQEVEESLLKQYSMAPPGAKAPEVSRNTEIYYGEKLSTIWKDLARKKSALSIPCELPRQASPQDLEIGPDPTPALHLSHHVDLQILRRALHLMLDARMLKIESPRLSYEVVDLENNPDYQLVYQRITFVAWGPYESFVQVLNGAQKVEDGLLQVFLMDLGSRSSSEVTRLRGILEFSAFYRLERADKEAS